MLTEASIRQSFAERLLVARKRKSLTQAELAELVEMHQSHIAHYESGRRTPTVKTLVLMSVALRVTTDYLLGRE